MASHASHAENYYDVLGVPRSASTDEIKAVYRKLVLVHHPDRTRTGKGAESSVQDATIHKINEAYDTLSDADARAKYDVDLFGMSWSPHYKGDRHDNYVRMTAADVDQMFSGLNEYQRFSTANYHAARSAIAPGAIGRRRTNFQERKQFRASKLPSKSASVGWLGFPIAILALWGFNLASATKTAKKTKYQ